MLKQKFKYIFELKLKNKYIFEFISVAINQKVSTFIVSCKYFYILKNIFMKKLKLFEKNLKKNIDFLWKMDKFIIMNI